ncbi:MAG: LolA family protein [Flavicella sp.]
MKKNLIFTTLLFISYNTFAQNSEKAATLLNEVASKMASYTTMHIDFSYELINTEVDIKQVSSGSVITKAEKYNLNFMNNTFIHDGDNTYVIVAEDEEVNIIEGGDEEDLLNPSKLLFFYKEGYQYQWKESKTINGKKIQFIKLIPIDTKTEASHFVLGIDVSKKHIYNISETGENSTVTTFTINSLKVNEQTEDNVFSFDEASYIKKNYTINR